MLTSPEALSTAFHTAVSTASAETASRRAVVDGPPSTTARFGASPKAASCVAGWAAASVDAPAAGAATTHNDTIHTSMRQPFIGMSAALSHTGENACKRIGGVHGAA